MSFLSIRKIGLPAAQWKAIEKKAKQAGVTPAAYVRYLIECDLFADQSLDEILRPIREDVRKSGITEIQLEQIVDRARRATSPRRKRT